MDIFICDRSIFCRFDFRTVEDAGPYSTKFHSVTIRVNVQKILQQGTRRKYMAIPLQWSYHPQPTRLRGAFAIYLWKPHSLALWWTVCRRLGVWALPKAFVIQMRNLLDNREANNGTTFTYPKAVDWIRKAIILTATDNADRPWKSVGVNYLFTAEQILRLRNSERSSPLPCVNWFLP